jgi:hypothetical protein
VKGAEEYAQSRGVETVALGASAQSMKAQLDQLSGAIRAVKEQRLPQGMDPAAVCDSKASTVRTVDAS